MVQGWARTKVSLTPCRHIPIGGEEIFYLGSSEDEDSDQRRRKRRRREKIGKQYLEGLPLIIDTASLRGPFRDDWKNPWAKPSRSAIIKEEEEEREKEKLESARLRAATRRLRVQAEPVQIPDSTDARTNCCFRKVTSPPAEDYRVPIGHKADSLEGSIAEARPERRQRSADALHSRRVDRGWLGRNVNYVPERRSEPPTSPTRFFARRSKDVTKSPDRDPSRSISLASILDSSITAAHVRPLLHPLQKPTFKESQRSAPNKTGNVVHDPGNAQASRSPIARYTSIKDVNEGQKSQNQAICDLWGVDYTYKWFHGRLASPTEQLVILAEYTGRNYALRDEILHRGVAAMLRRLRLRTNTQSGNYSRPEELQWVIDSELQSLKWWITADLQWMIDSKSWRGQPIPVIKDEDLKRYGLELFLDRPKVTEPTRGPGRESHSFGTHPSKPPLQPAFGFVATTQPDLKMNPAGRRLETGNINQPGQQISMQQQGPSSRHGSPAHTRQLSRQHQQPVEAPSRTQSSNSQIIQNGIPNPGDLENRRMQEQRMEDQSFEWHRPTQHHSIGLCTDANFCSQRCRTKTCKPSKDSNPQHVQIPHFERPRPHKRKLSFTDSGNVKTSKRPTYAGGNLPRSGTSLQPSPITDDVSCRNANPRTTKNGVAIGVLNVQQPSERLIRTEALDPVKVSTSVVNLAPPTGSHDLGIEASGRKRAHEVIPPNRIEVQVADTATKSTSPPVSVNPTISATEPQANARGSSNPKSTSDSMRLNGFRAEESFTSISNLPEAQIVPALPLLRNQSSSDISTNLLKSNRVGVSGTRALEEAIAVSSGPNDIPPQGPSLMEVDIEGDSYADLSTQAAMSKAQATFRDSHTPLKTSSPLIARKTGPNHSLTASDPVTPDAQHLSTQVILEGLRASPLGASTGKKPMVAPAIAVAETPLNVSSPNSLGPRSKVSNAAPVKGSSVLPAETTDQVSPPVELVTTGETVDAAPLGRRRSTPIATGSPRTSSSLTKAFVGTPPPAQNHHHHCHDLSPFAARPTLQGSKAVSKSRFEIFYNKTLSPTDSSSSARAPAVAFPSPPCTMPKTISRSDGSNAAMGASVVATINSAAEASASSSKEAQSPHEMPMASMTIGAILNGKPNDNIQDKLCRSTASERLTSTWPTVNYSQSRPPERGRHQHNPPLLSDKRIARNAGISQKPTLSGLGVLHRAIQEKWDISFTPNGARSRPHGSKPFARIQEWGGGKELFIRKEMLKTPEPPIAANLTTTNTRIQACGQAIPATNATKFMRESQAAGPAITETLQKPANSKAVPPQANSTAIAKALETTTANGRMPSADMIPASSRPRVAPPSQATGAKLPSKPAKRASFADIQPLSSPSHFQFLNGSLPELPGGHRGRSLSMETSSLEEQAGSPVEAPLSPVKRIAQGSEPSTNGSLHDPAKCAQATPNRRATSKASSPSPSTAATSTATARTSFSMPPSGDLSQLSPSQILQDGQPAQVFPIPTQPSIVNGNLPLSTGLGMMSTARSGNQADGVEEGSSEVGFGIDGIRHGLMKPMESWELDDALDDAGNFLSTDWDIERVVGKRG